VILDILDFIFLAINAVAAVLLAIIIVYSLRLARVAWLRGRDSPTAIVLFGVAAWSLSVFSNVTLWVLAFFLAHDALDTLYDHRTQTALLLFYAALQLGPTVGIYMAWLRMTKTE
jgi:hypothetical protein